MLNNARENNKRKISENFQSSGLYDCVDVLQSNKNSVTTLSDKMKELLRIYQDTIFVGQGERNAAQELRLNKVKELTNVGYAEKPQPKLVFGCFFGRSEPKVAYEGLYTPLSERFAMSANTVKETFYVNPGENPDAEVDKVLEGLFVFTLANLKMSEQDPGFFYRWGVQRAFKNSPLSGWVANLPSNANSLNTVDEKMKALLVIFQDNMVNANEKLGKDLIKAVEQLKTLTYEAGKQGEVRQGNKPGSGLSSCFVCWAVAALVFAGLVMNAVANMPSGIEGLIQRLFLMAGLGVLAVVAVPVVLAAWLIYIVGKGVYNSLNAA